MYPRLVIDCGRLRENGQRLCALAGRNGLDRLAFVTKSFCAMPEMVQVLEELPNPYLADSRVGNLEKLAFSGKKKILLRLPMLSQADRVVQAADISFCSEPAALAALDAAAQRAGKRHGVVLMVDMGDLREGVFFRDADGLLVLARQAEDAPGLELAGMAFNVTCYGSVIPTQQTLADFRRLVTLVEEALGRRLELVSCGNSSSVYLLGKADFAGFNNLRLGESLLLGRETAYGADLPELHQDVLTLECEVVEVRTKPTYPVGKLGVNAFGQTVEYTDRGDRLRAIAAIGQQDIDWTGLTPCMPGMEIFGASSDHLLLDVTDCPARVGDVVRFRVDYSAALRAFTSPYVEKVCKSSQKASL